jgi:hypothetical protein
MEPQTLHQWCKPKSNNIRPEIDHKIRPAQLVQGLETVTSLIHSYVQPRGNSYHNGNKVTTAVPSLRG